MITEWCRVSRALDIRGEDQLEDVVVMFIK